MSEHPDVSKPDDVSTDHDISKDRDISKDGDTGRDCETGIADAAVEDPQQFEMSWIRGLAKPADAEPTHLLPFYGSLVALDSGPANPAAPSVNRVPDAERTGPLRRISAEQVDTLISHLDTPTPDAATPDAATPDAATPDPDPAEADLGGTGSDQSVLTTLVETTDAGADGDSTAGGSKRAHTLAFRARLRKPVVIAVAATLCLLTIGGATLAAMDKTVSIVVDGQTQKVSTLSNSVSGALAAAGISPTSHDTLAPGLNSKISDGSVIVLDRGRLVTVTVDGQQREVWTTARTDDAAVAQLTGGISDLAAANRSRAIPLAPAGAGGAPLAADAAPPAATLRTVQLSVAGRAATRATTGAHTVGELLALNNISLGARDRVWPALTTRVWDGLVVRVDRVQVSNASRRVALPQPAGRTVADATMVKGKSTVVQRGRAGSELITYTVTTLNGKVTSKVQSGRRVVIAPVGTVTHVGTKTTFTYSGNEVFTNDTTFGVNWDGLANCESTHNPRAVNANPSAGLPTYGLFQFDLPTWASVGGSGNPMDASPEEQLMRAKLLFQQRGLSPWACAYAAH